MSDIVIRSENLSKRYRIGERERYLALRDVLARSLSAPARLFRPRARISGNGNGHPSHIWALKDVSFEVRQGEVVGIIGRNGAGKTTLLKILARVTKPTHGFAEVRGRMGSLLEVGTGFHPELTGRENVFLSGAILGMSKSEIRRKFDEIVAFAEVEKFIDTPLKHYSTGMQMRLAFAVAAHLEPEILLVDEVLAVGDAAFQKKCLGKMGDVAKTGRTILFVSHNMASMRSICQRGIELDRGGVAASGEVNAVIDQYLASLIEETSRPRTIETSRFILQELDIASANASVIRTFDNITIRLLLRAKVDIAEAGVYVGFLTLENERIAGLDFRDFRAGPCIPAGEQCEFSFQISKFPLIGGEYQLEIHLKDMGALHVERIESLFRFGVAETPVYGGRKLDGWFGNVGLKATVAAQMQPRTGELATEAVGQR